MDSEMMRLREVPSGAGVLCSQILATLPSSFGNEESNRHYAEIAERSPAIIASVDDQDIGLLVVVRHSPSAAEIYVMAVRPEWHRHGVGRRLSSAPRRHSPARASSSCRSRP